MVLGEEEGRTATNITFTDKVADRIIDKLSEKEKKGFLKRLFKGSKSPIPVKIDENKMKKGWVIVILLRTNGNLDIQKLPISEGMIRLKDNETYHMAEADYIWRYKKYPVLILPEFSVEPLKAINLAEEVRKEGKGVDAQRFIIKAIEMSQIEKKKMGGSKVILWIIAAIVIIYLAFQFIGGKIS
jgi:hypothetical protein